MDGALLKLTILPFLTSRTFAGGPPSGPPFVAQFNPTELTDSYEVNFQNETKQGDSGEPAKQYYIKPRNFTFELMLDGSGVTSATGFPENLPSTPASVIGQIELFKLTTGYNGKIHRNPYLLLVWGPFFVTSVLESYSINYKIFNSIGLPVRAILSATFREHKDDVLGNLLDNRSSPDVAHAHLTGEGDTLPNVVNEVYRDPGRYIDVARANGLNTVRALETGSEIVMPPVRSA
ncbi:hypothetical protein R3X27_15190 [Tropicimonas sp. TH_r6]|uniref:CIS tube protein n=1 Tax=Tropicimonas sp. TH_r6 TaxID=3082085 RepID=UPI002953245B|nr:hypothetical protein [Tropicimonas sp. TH_r6]MDV7144032.1 hypothetical protein [Tropicimonas sp. TH_r6]